MKNNIPVNMHNSKLLLLQYNNNEGEESGFEKTDLW